MSQFQLLNVQNAKTPKGEILGIKTGIVYLASADISGYEVCPMRSPGCTDACIYKQGRARIMKAIPAARIRRTKMFFEQRADYMVLLAEEIASLSRSAIRNGMRPAIRLNGTSDILFERVPFEWGGIRYSNIMAAFPLVQFYDYTKHLPEKRLPHIPSNYDLTFSRSETNEETAKRALQMGMRISAVFYPTLPAEYLGAPVVDGDQHDCTFLHPAGTVLGLKAKGTGKADQTGFIIRNAA